MNTKFYKAFEDKHRGSRDLISSRLEVYLPFITHFKSIYPNASAVDLGCGRGEWLETLNTNGFLSQGIDLDDSMLSACRERHLNIQTAEAVSFLKQLPDESQTIVSAFHLVEHIPFESLQELVIESLRVLKPAGILILETPNPENIKVATENFYLDPTHIKPIPSSLLSFLPEFYGFKRTKILRLQENKNLTTKDNINLLDVIEGASPDYAVISQKQAGIELLKQFDDAFAQDFGLPLTTLSAKFEDRLQKIESIAHQAEARAGQAEARAEQLCMKLDSIYNSRSWRITAPLRWVTHQTKLLSEQGFFARIKALVKKIIKPLVLRGIAYINTHSSLRNKLVKASRKLGFHDKLRDRYLNLSKQTYTLGKVINTQQMHMPINTFSQPNHNGKLSINEILSRIQHELATHQKNNNQ